MVEPGSPSTAHVKYRKLVEVIGEFESVIVAFSGGVDSSLLLAAAVDALGANALAIAALSASYPASERADAREVADALGARFETVSTDEMSDPSYSSNPVDRCYHCKTHLFATLNRLAGERGIRYVLEGSNADDESDYRPGLKAVSEQKARSPLREVGLTKNEIRLLLREMGLPVWDKPAQACLASRVPYGHRITPEGLDRIGRAELAIRDLGYRVVRVRDWGHLAVVEVGSDQLTELLKPGAAAAVTALLQAVGYRRVAIDTMGYRTGSLNESFL